MSDKCKFIIYAPPYDERSGGSIVLHKLCDLLNKQGHTALVWPMSKPHFTWSTAPLFCARAVAYYGSRLYRKRYSVRQHFDTPIAVDSDITISIVIYPETVNNNPLGAAHHVRWFLHRPGFHTGKHEYKKGELYFCYQEAFNSPEPDMIYGGKLTITESFRDIYRITNPAPRTKICYMVRKGEGRQDLPSLANCWVVDYLGHHELADAFNECARCYFYDPHTMYSAYAALCGCIPIIVPLPGVSKEQWIPEEELRFGLAYGEDDIPHALATRDQLIARMDRDQESNSESVRRFVTVVRDFFNLPANGDHQI
jgi:hypothetical protein